MLTTFDRLSVGERFLFSRPPVGCCVKTGPTSYETTMGGSGGFAAADEPVVSVDAPTPNRRPCRLVMS